ncbi:hypothetical protein BH20ACT6_BH20ACT6_11850 [soil metagenome]
MRDRIADVGVTGAVVGVLGLCCGLPVLLSLGFLGALAGISSGSWVLIALGLATVAFGFWRRRERRYRSAHGSSSPVVGDRDGHDDVGAESSKGSR